MRLYPTHWGLSTPFVVFFFKRTRFFLTKRIISFKTIVYIAEKTQAFFNNRWSPCQNSTKKEIVCSVPALCLMPTDWRAQDIRENPEFKLHHW
jgi:hypothetical protein